MKKLICFFIGHKPSEFTDSGYEYCKRCQTHEYYDYSAWKNTIPYIARNFKDWCKWQWRKSFHKCIDCKKPIIRFGKYTGDHSNCLPF